MIGIQKIRPLYIFLKKLKYHWLSWRYKTTPISIMQTASTTFMDRHPDIFEFIKLQFGEKSIRILSFGCSTGEECFSLRKYLPNAHIIGVDINPSSIETAKKSILKDEKMEFLNLTIEDLKKLEKFDAIMGLSVLCKNPEAQELQDISTIYPFSRFNDAISVFDSILNANGFLIIRSSNFRMRDTDVFNKYDIVDFENRREPLDFPKFDSKNKRLNNFLETEEFFQKK
jgi:hypothetical protein